MNAYELADAIDITLGKNVDVLNILKAAVILREQADRISVLEANDEIQLNIVKKQQDYIDQLEQGLRASIELNKAQAERQVKELTDEEINELYMEHGNKDWDWQIDFARAILRKAQEK
jgi:hypothetical protein